MSFNNANLVSTTYTGNTTILAERGREYFLIQATDAALTLTLGFGDGSIEVPNGGYYEPYVAPSTQIDIVTAGSFVVVTNV